MDFRGRTSHKYYTVGVYYYNETSHQRELSNKRLLGKPGQIEYSGIISLLVAGLVCTLVGVIVGGLVVGHRYSLLKLQLADTKVRHPIIFSESRLTLSEIQLDLANLRDPRRGGSGRHP